MNVTALTKASVDTVELHVESDVHSEMEFMSTTAEYTLFSYSSGLAVVGQFCCEQHVSEKVLID